MKKTEASVQKLTKDLNQAQASLKSIGASKVDKKEQAAAVAKINKTIAPIRKELDALIPISKDLSSLSSELKALDKNIKSESESLKESLTKTNNDLIQIQNSLAVLGDQKIDKASLQALLELESFKAKKHNKLVIDQAAEAIEKRLDALVKRTKSLEQNLKQLKQTTSKVPVSKPLLKTKSTDSGDILEQDIKE